MLRKDFARTTDGIGATDFYKMAMDFHDRQKQKELDANEIMSGYQKGVNMQRQNALADALQSGDEEAINKAAAAYNPQGQLDYIQRIKQARADADLEFQRQKELADYNHALDMKKQDRKDAIARELANIRANGNGLVNINMNNPFDKKRIETRAKNMDENIAKSQSLIDDYNQAEALLNKNSFNTGAGYGVVAPITAMFNDDAAQFQALVNKIVPTMRPAGSGSTSDRDMAIFEKATFGFDKPREANLNIIRGRRAVEENNKAKEELFAEYITNGMGTPADFDREWRRYLNANPIFGDDQGNTLNKTRVSAYDWFGGNDNDPFRIR